MPKPTGRPPSGAEIKMKAEPQPQPQTVDVAVIGAGAVGAFYGARLQKNGCRVFYQSRYSADGDDEKTITLKVNSIWESFQLDAEFFSSVARMPRADLVILATKVLPGIDYAELIEPVLKPGSTIVVLQNGINIEETLMKTYTANPVVGALAFTCINRIDKNQIDHLDYGLIKLAAATEEYEPQAAEVYNLFSNAGIKTGLDRPLRKLRYEKLLWNVPFNSLSVVAGGVTTDKMIASEKLRELIFVLMQEVGALSNAEGYEVSEQSMHDMIERTENMSAYKTSMLLDYLAGRPMEVEAILGEPLRLAQQHGLNLPNMKAMYALLSFYNEKS